MKLSKYPVTFFIKSKQRKQLLNNRALFYINKRIKNYDINSGKIFQYKLNPISVALCPTPRCFRHCSFCSNKQRNKINLQKGNEYSEKAFREIIEDLNNMNVRGVTIAGGGEPLAYPHKFLDKFLSEKNLKFKTGLHTNGVNLRRALTQKILNSKNISYINISVVAHNPKLYSQITNAPRSQFYLIEDNIKHAVNLKNNFVHSPHLGVKILLCRENYRFIKEMKKYFDELKVDEILIRCVGNFEPGQDAELSKKQTDELKKILYSMKLSEDKINSVLGIRNKINKIPSRCWINTLQYAAGIDPDGEVYLCSPWSRGGYSIGNVNKKRFIDIWGSKRHQKIILKLNENLIIGRCNPLTCRHFYTNFLIDQFISGKIKLPKVKKDSYLYRFI